MLLTLDAPSPLLIAALLQLYDSNKDGFITLQEFTQALELFGQLDDPEEQYKCEHVCACGQGRTSANQTLGSNAQQLTSNT